MSSKTMKVVLLESGKEACVVEIGSSLAGMQKVVGGLIEAIYPFEEQVCIVCNGEGKIHGLPLNRGLYTDDGKLFDIIAGTAFICDCSGENFGSLSEEQLERYRKLFRHPQWFVNVDGSIVGIPYDPMKP